MMYRRAFPREQLEDFVNELAFSYPKCFFEIIPNAFLRMDASNVH